MADKNTPTNRQLARRTPPSLRDFDRAFEALWNQAHAALAGFPFEGATLRPWTEFGAFRTAPTDVVDTGTAYQIRTEVPGIAKDQIDVRVNGNVVEISAEDRSEKSEKSPSYLHRERTYTGFQRSFELPESVVAGQAKAKVVDGVLQLELPKQKPTPSPSETRIRIE